MLPVVGPRQSGIFGRVLRFAALWVAVVLSAGLMVFALSSPKFSWLGWVTLIPLFLSIRMLSPISAAVCGGSWGFSLYALSSLVAGTDVPHTWHSLLLLVEFPAFFAGVAAAITRRKGFHPFLLGLGWVGLELVFQPLGLKHGLIASTLGGGWFVATVGNLGGYILVAFVLALVNAWLLSLISSVRLPVASMRSIAIPRDYDHLLVVIEHLCKTTRLLSPAQPRAPPVLYSL